MDEAFEIGRHRLMAGDVTAGALSTLMGGELADVVYGDPPWGQALLTAFATMAGGAPRLAWMEFLDALAVAIVGARKPEAPVFLEMGCRWERDLVSTMRAIGLPLRRRWEVTYGSRSKPRPSLLLLFGPTDVAVRMPDPPFGEPVTRAALLPVVREGTVVLDPCTGLGMTARITHALGGSFRGLELNPTRLERTAAWLRKHP